MQRSLAPDFKLHNIVWQCWIVSNGQAYEWRSTCSRYSVVREDRSWRAKRGDRIGTVEYPTIKAAMLGASLEQRRAA